MSVIGLSQTERETPCCHCQKPGGIRGNCLPCGDDYPWQCWPLLVKRSGSIGCSFQFYMQALPICCTGGYASVDKWVQAYVDVCLLCHVKRHVSMTKGQSMTISAYYKTGTFHYSPWHSNSHTLHHLNQTGTNKVKLTSSSIPRRYTCCCSLFIRYSLWLEYGRTY